MTVLHCEKVEEMNLQIAQKKQELKETVLQNKAEASNREEESKNIREQLTKALEDHTSNIYVKEEEINMQKDNLNRLMHQHTDEIAELSSQHQAKVDQLTVLHQEKNRNINQ
ncbi:unnamed protein product [Meganyctiphanes norvegica]|uniref:Uncharacterized protein n=1 Tax=Meganyctiphanes norvegica TaxID=48144 RepID=A0AAV2QQA2_MEGNR